jgi:hypothetical protein
MSNCWKQLRPLQEYVAQQVVSKLLQLHYILDSQFKVTAKLCRVNFELYNFESESFVVPVPIRASAPLRSASTVSLDSLSETGATMLSKYFRPTQSLKKLNKYRSLAE